MTAFLILIAMFAVAFVAAALAASVPWAAMEARSQDSAVAIIKDEQLSTIGIWKALLKRVSHVETLRRRIAEADLDWSVGRVSLAMLLVGLSALVFLSQLQVLSFVGALAAAGVCSLVPYFYILRLRRKRFETFARQFPEALDSLTRALKAGYPLASSIELLSMEQPEPLASEMRRVRDEWKLGKTWDQALDRLFERVPIPEVGLFVAAVKMQNRIGGRLNEVLARLSDTMRDNAAFEGEVRAISSHSRITGTVLTILPLVIGAMMFFVAPEYMSILLQKPVGRTLIVGCLVANLAAHFLIKRIARIKV